MHTRFTVGEVAKLSGLSKQTLIYYDREGVFVPRFIDPKNGYRYYTAEQLEVLDSILMLKEMGLSLDEIRSFMKSRNDSRAIELMAAQRQRIHEKMRRLDRTARKLERKIGTLEAFYEDTQEGVVIQDVAGDILAAEPVEAPGHLEEQDLALKRLLRRAKEENYPHYYQLGTMVALEAFARAMSCAHGMPFCRSSRIYRAACDAPRGGRRLRTTLERTNRRA